MHEIKVVIWKPKTTYACGSIIVYYIPKILLVVALGWIFSYCLLHNQLAMTEGSFKLNTSQLSMS